MTWIRPIGIALVLVGCGSTETPATPACGERFCHHRVDGEGTDLPMEVLALGDVDGDGALDLIAGSGIAFDRQIGVALGTEPGRFAASQIHDFGEGVFVEGFATGDFDGDGRSDFAVGFDDLVTPGATSGLAVGLAEGAGFFADPTTVGDISNANVLGAGRLTDDDAIDLVTDVGGDELVLWVGDGAGGFSVAAPVPWDAIGAPERSVIADFDGDGRDELVTAAGGMLVRFAASADGASAEIVTTPLDLDVRRVAKGDVDGDGDLDLALRGADGVLVLTGDGAGAFTPGEPLALTGDGSISHPVALAHLDADGRADLVTVENDGLAVRYATADGYQAAPDAWTEIPPKVAPVRVVTGDLDGDVIDDIVVQVATTALVAFVSL